MQTFNKLNFPKQLNGAEKPEPRFKIQASDSFEYSNTVYKLNKSNTFLIKITRLVLMKHFKLKLQVQNVKFS